MEHGKKFVKTFTGLCINSVEVIVDDVFIVDCKFIGGCNSNLKILRNNLIGEPIDQAHFALLANCCVGVNQKCVNKLVNELEKQFRMIAEELKG